MIDYKKTLNLPNTPFSMCANLAKNELNILKEWYENNLYEIIRNNRRGKKVFVLHDGPLYANGDIHIGHAVNKILKDIIIKFKIFMGYNINYIPGWDCHGLPIELKIEKLFQKSNKKINSKIFRKLCRQYVLEQVEKQKKDFIRLGVLSDWYHPYLTMDFMTEANIIRTLGQVIDNGYVYQGFKPVHWCINCCSALAESEVEYYNQISPSIDVKFIATDNNIILNKFNVSHHKVDQISFIIWTTMPWTLPASRAIAIHPEFEYQLIQINNQNYIIAADLVQSVMNRINILNWIILGSVQGSALELLEFRHPFMDFNVLVVLSKHVTLDVGTGAVHTAPSHGVDDYIIGKKYNLDISSPVGPDGCYIPGTLGKLDNISVFQSNHIIMDLLRNNNTLLQITNFKHSYPYCWRHKSKLIFRSTPQWFISLDKFGLREKLLNQINCVQWIPNTGKLYIENMIKSRPDWCISRQNTWGVPITLFVHRETKLLHPQTLTLLELIAKKVEIYGIQAWWDIDPVELLGNDAPYYKKIDDTLDVWFDSGSTNFSVMPIRLKCIDHISDMYLEGIDQYRGWFMSSLVLSTIINDKAPYYQIVTHGFVVDGIGRKMSKSEGNVIKPQQVINKFGSDVFRLWVASTNYTHEMTISNEILQRSVDMYRKIRNTVRFILANLYDFDPISQSVHCNHMIMLDRWAIDCAYILQQKIIHSYTNYNFHDIVKYIMKFCSIDMSSFYFEVIKDRQYTAKPDSIARRSSQTALYHIIEALVRWIAPITSFTAHEIWNFIPGKRQKYIFTEEWYTGLFKLDSTNFFNNNYWNLLMQIRDETNKIIESEKNKKIINSSLEAHITFYAKPDLAIILRSIEHELHFLFLTSSVSIEDDITTTKEEDPGDKLKGLKIFVNKANGKKCQRCWHYNINVGQNIYNLEICNRCIVNIFGLGENRVFI